MKKGKTTLAAITLGALTYLAWLGLDIKNSDKPEPATTPYKVVSDTVAPGALVASVDPVPAPRRVLARKAVKFRKSAHAPQAEEAIVAPEEKKPNVEIPMPAVWEGSFVKHDRPYKKDDCDIDRPCSPRGRDGVLLVGASFSLKGWQPVLPEILSLGSYQRRTPLLVYQ